MLILIIEFCYNTYKISNMMYNIRMIKNIFSYLIFKNRYTISLNIITKSLIRRMKLF